MSLRKCHTSVPNLRAIRQNSSHHSTHRNSSRRSIRARQKCSNSFVMDSHSVHVLEALRLQSTMKKLVKLVESYLASSFCILLHTTSIESSCESGPQTCLYPPKIRSNQLQNVPSQSLHVSQPTQDLRADTHRRHHPRIFLLLSRLDHTLEGFLVLV